MDLLDELDQRWGVEMEEDEHLFKERRQYRMPKRVTFDDWDDLDFVQRFRLSKATVREVTEMVKPDLTFPGHDER